MIYENILQLCEKNNTSIYALEKELGFGKSTISKWRKASPSIENLKKVADFFDVSMDLLLANDPGNVYAGNVVVYRGNDQVCGSRFDSLWKLIDLIRLFGNGKVIRVFVYDSEDHGDGAVY